MDNLTDQMGEQFLYWVTTKDHDEDWFVVAKSDTAACSFREEYEGYSPGEARAKKICSVPAKYYEEESCHAQLDLLEDIGFTVISDSPVRVVRRDGKIYREGLVPYTTLFEIADEHGPGVYIIRVSGTKKFKIGIASNFRKHFQDLQTGSPEELEPYHFYPTMICQELEKHLHRKFREYSIGREWFEFGIRDIENVHITALKFINSDLTEDETKYRKIIEERYKAFPELEDI
jgi:hypothetical protein